VVAGLGEADDRGALPAPDGVRADEPLRHLPRRLRRDQAADDVPAVLGDVAPVEQHQAAGDGLDGEAALRVPGSENERLARRDRVGFHVLVPSPVVERRVAGELGYLRVGRPDPHRPGRIQREDARTAVDQVGLLEVRGGEELEVEAGPSLEPRRQRLVEKHAHEKAVVLRPHDHPGVEREVVVSEPDLDAVVLPVDLPLDDPRDLVPLPRPASAGRRRRSPSSRHGV
jgi:hypothetical protein